MMIDFHTHAPLSDRYLNRDEILVVQSMMSGDAIDMRANYITYGIHPLSPEAPSWVEAYKADPQLAETRLLATIQTIKDDPRTPKLLGIGECGWDKRSEVLTMEDQTLLFRLHVVVARRLRLPLILHVVGGWHHVLAERKHSPAEPWVVHGFRGKSTLLQQLLNAGISISMSPSYDWSLLPPITSFFLETDESQVTIDEQYERVADFFKMSHTELESALVCNFNAL